MAIGALLALLALSAKPAEAVISGSNLSAAVNGTICTADSGLSSCTYAISTLPFASQATAGPRAGINGVIVSWRLKVGASTNPHSVKLRVLHGAEGSGTGPTEVVPAGAEAIHGFPARLPVRAGDAIGIDIVDEPQNKGVPSVRIGVSGAVIDAWRPPLADGQTAPPLAQVGNVELLMNVSIEPDLDGDGYGDETQDGCPGINNAGAACPLSVPEVRPSAPQTRITQGPRGMIRKRSATFRFVSPSAGGATFQCRLDRAKFRPCKSPKTYRGLGKGRHSFRVRAVSTAGVVDSTPAQRAFRVAP